MRNALVADGIMEKEVCHCRLTRISSVVVCSSSSNKQQQQQMQTKIPATTTMTKRVTASR